MKTISHFFNFKEVSTPLIDWIRVITKTVNANPIFCNKSLKKTNKEKSFNLIIEDNTTEVISKQSDLVNDLPSNLSSHFPSKDFSVFNLEKILKSDDVFEEITSSDLILITCPEITDKGIFLDELNAKIINQAKCPVLMIPEDIDSPKSLQNMVYVTDIRFTELRFVKAFAKVSKAFSTQLTLSHASDSGIPDLDIKYGNQLFEDCFGRKITDCSIKLENLRRLDIQKYPDMIHEYLLGDIYGILNKNKQLKAGNYLQSVSIKLAQLSKKPVLLINN